METIEDNIKDIDDKINNLEDKIKKVDVKLDKILELLASDCAKMREHIDFVETVYDNVKMPFNYIMDRANTLLRVVGTDSVSTESIADK